MSHPDRVCSLEVKHNKSDTNISDMNISVLRHYSTSYCLSDIRKHDGLTLVSGYHSCVLLKIIVLLRLISYRFYITERQKVQNKLDRCQPKS